MRVRRSLWWTNLWVVVERDGVGNVGVISKRIVKRWWVVAVFEKGFWGERWR